MKSLDFSHPGKMPGSQDRLNYLQTAWTELFNGIIQEAGDGTTPFVISGCAVTKALGSGTTYNYSIAAGWLYYNGVALRVPASGPLAVDTSINALYLAATAANSTLTYNDGSTPTVVLDQFIGLSSHTIGTADDASKFLIDHLQTGNWQFPTLAGVFVGGGPSPIMFRKAIGSRTVNITGQTDPMIFATLMTTTQVFTLPVGYRPAQDKIFIVANGGIDSYAIVEVGASGIVSIRGDLHNSVNTNVFLEITFDIG